MLQLIVYGLISGSILALGAIGLTLIYGILNFANFAHGDLMALGAYLALFFKVSLALPMWLAFILGMIFRAADALHAEGALLHDSLAARGYVGIKLQL